MSWINKLNCKKENNKKGQKEMVKKKSLQDLALDEMIKRKKIVTIYLNNGVRLQGLIDAYDQYVISLPYEGKSQLIYKSSISTIQGVKFH